MQVIHTGRHFTVTDGLREHVEKHLPQVERYSNHIDELQLTYRVEHITHYVDAKVIVPHQPPIITQAEDKDMYVAIDKLFATLNTLLRKVHDKHSGHRE